MEAKSTVPFNKPCTKPKCKKFEDVISLMFKRKKVTQTAEDVGEKDAEEDGDVAVCDLIVNPPSPRSEENDPNASPHALFLRLPERLAASWRRDPLLDVTHSRDNPVFLDQRLTTQQKASVISKSLTSDFVQWMHCLGTQEKPSLTQEDLEAMFSMELDEPATRAVAARKEELRFVPVSVAKEMGQPKKSVEMGLRQTLHRDKVLSHQPQLPATLISMADVWDGITDLRSTRAFLHWLEQQRHWQQGESLLPPPAPYLLEAGLQTHAAPVAEQLSPATTRWARRRHTLAAAFHLLPGHASTNLHRHSVQH